MREMKDSGVKWIGKIPRDWSVECLKYIYNKANVGESIDKDYTTDDDNDYVFYTAGLKPIHTKYCDFPRNKYTKEHDLLLARNGTPYVYLPNNNSVYSDHIIRISIENNVDRRFVRYSLQQAIESLKVEVVSIATWSISLWKKQKLPLPQLVVQQRIADYLDSKCSQIDSIIEKQKQIIEKLKEYKTSLITEVVTKGLDPNVEMKDSGIEWVGKIPLNHTIRKIKHCIRGLTDGTHGTFQRVENGKYLLSAKNVFEKGLLIGDKESLISEQDYHEITKNGYPQKGDILLCCVGTVGRCMIYDRDEPIAFQRSVIFIRCNNKIILPKMMFYCLQTSPVNIQERLAVNKSAQEGIYQGAVSNIYIVFPKLITEQESIITYLDDKCSKIEISIEKKEQIIEKLKEYKKSLIYEVVTGKREV